MTDGQKIRFCNFQNNEKIISPLFFFNRESFKELVKVYLSLDKKDLSSKHLLLDFSINDIESPSKKLTKVLYNCLEKPSQKTYMLHSEWERLFKLANHNENNLKKIKERDHVMAHCFNISQDKFDSTRGLFSLQTAYTIIIKLVAYHIISGIFFKNTNLKFENLIELETNSLRNRLENIENGDIFKKLGINNLLEGDFFSWYVDKETWNPELFYAIKECISTLAIYDDNQIIFSKNNLHDLFIDLYESMIPNEVRHSLGEYYTPNWLAEHVIKNIEKPVGWKGLDPCAGSGTFVIKMIQQILNDDKELDHNLLLLEILNRIKAIDINPLAVLTCRINYFLAISHLIDYSDSINIEIPVYLGDSAFVPLVSEINGVCVINYSISTQKKKIDFSLPLSVISNKKELSRNISLLENSVIEKNKPKAVEILTQLMNPEEKRKEVIDKIEEFIGNLIYLEDQHWDRIWIRIIFGFLNIATLGRFQVIVGNPPWIDWKSLPDGYRENLKSICIERHLFSGDTFTGGINLNICALIANVVANNWLEKEGNFGFLMPKSILFQQSYKGFRDLIQTDGVNLKFFKFYDWSEAGHPFYPVTEKFMTVYFKKTNNSQLNIIPVIKYKKKKGFSIKDSKNESLGSIEERFDKIKLYAFMNEGKFNNFTFESNLELIPYLRKLSGNTIYRGRVGLGIYPKELLLFKMIEKKSNGLWLENYQGKATERKIAKRPVVLEDKYLFPVIESPNIQKFGLKNVNLIAPFPYTINDIKKPIPEDILKKESSLLYQYYEDNKDLMKKTKYNQRVQGNKGAYYSQTRVGKYTFGKYRVVYRNNTKWVSTVITDVDTNWGGKKMYLLLDHACSIGQDNTGRFITEDEAHYICAILNSDIVIKYIINSSDSRSFKTDLPLNIVKYDQNNAIHKNLMKISKLAHEKKLTTNQLENELEKSIKEYINQL